MERPDDLAAELHRAAVVDPELLDAPADALPGLEHRDVGASESEVARCGKAGEPGAEHEDVGQAAYLQLAGDRLAHQPDGLVAVDEAR